MKYIAPPPKEAFNRYYSAMPESIYEEIANGVGSTLMHTLCKAECLDAMLQDAETKNEVVLIGEHGALYYASHDVSALQLTHVGANDEVA